MALAPARAMALAAISEFADTAHLVLKVGGVPFEGLAVPLRASGPAPTGKLRYWSWSCCLNGTACVYRKIIATRGEALTSRCPNSMVAWGTRPRGIDSGAITWMESSDRDLASQLSDDCRFVPHTEMVGRVKASMVAHLTWAHPISDSDENLAKSLREQRARLLGLSTMKVAEATLVESISSVPHHPRAVIEVDSTGAELAGGAGGDGGGAGGAAGVEEGGDVAQTDRRALGSSAGMTGWLATREARLEAVGPLYSLLQESYGPGTWVEGMSLIHKSVVDSGPASRILAVRGGLSSSEAATLEAIYAHMDALAARRRNALMRIGRDKNLRLRDLVLAHLADLEVIKARGLLLAVKEECVANCELLGLGSGAGRMSTVLVIFTPLKNST